SLRTFQYMGPGAESPRRGGLGDKQQCLVNPLKYPEGTVSRSVWVARLVEDGARVDDSGRGSLEESDAAGMRPRVVRRVLPCRFPRRNDHGRRRGCGARHDARELRPSPPGGWWLVAD